MRTRLLRAALIPLAMMAALLPSNPAGATVADEAVGPGIRLDCVFLVKVEITPGITPTPQLSVFDSRGLTGQATCTGTVNSRPVNGPGTVSLRAEEVASCTRLEGGHGWFTLRVPTSYGFSYITGTYTSGGGTITGGMTGTAAVVSIDAGDCYNTPVTKLTTRAQVHVGPLYS
jgi:hypothetical protein